jgi:hypothetical protein
MESKSNKESFQTIIEKDDQPILFYQLTFWLNHGRVFGTMRLFGKDIALSDSVIEGQQQLVIFEILCGITHRA